MLTDVQQRQITDFCRKHHIIKFWLVDEAFDAPPPRPVGNGKYAHGNRHIPARQSS